MLSFPDEVWAALKSHQSGYMQAVASYQGAQATLRVASGSLSVNGAQRIQTSGSVVLAGQAPSFVPKVSTDLLAPYGQELSLFRVVKVSTAEWVIPLGVFPITRTANSREWKRGDTVLSWEVECEFSDRLLKLDQDDFLSVDGPQGGAMVWSEVARLSRIPIQTTVTDATVPKATSYDSRIDGIETVLGFIDSDPHVTRTGVLTARPRDRWLTETVPDFEVDAVIDWSDEWSGEFYNQVAARSSTDADVTSFAVLSDESNPLSVSRAGGRTYKHSSPVYTTKAAAQAGAQTTLERLLNRRSRTVRVVCTPEALLLEPGDFGRFTDPVNGRTILGEVRAMTISADVTAPIPVDVIVAEQ